MEKVKMFLLGGLLHRIYTVYFLFTRCYMDWCNVYCTASQLTISLLKIRKISTSKPVSAPKISSTV